MSILLKGVTEAIQQAPRRIWRRDTGWLTEVAWEGTRAKIYAVAKELTKDGGADELEMDDAKTKCRLVARFSDEAGDGSIVQPSGNANLSERWELDTVDEELDIRLLPAFATLSESDAQKVQKAIDNGATQPSGLSSIGITYWKLMVKGASTKSVQRFVLRRTVTTGWRSTYQAAFALVGTVVTDPYEGVPLIPGTTRKKLTLPAGEWLVRAPTASAVGRKIEIRQEWWGATKWSAALYTGGTGTP